MAAGNVAHVPMVRGMLGCWLCGRLATSRACHELTAAEPRLPTVGLA
jgi:hypothetical protein